MTQTYDIVFTYANLLLKSSCFFNVRKFYDVIGSIPLQVRKQKIYHGENLILLSENLVRHHHLLPDNLNFIIPTVDISPNFAQEIESI